ncbi:Putrescine/proton symporter, putrescine/ornithine antiporter PotE [Enterobacter asburiae]|uniref:Putrescine/proton symporter, putrescine/ornithine antiporter PotE n=1 Tax=Enterobacter asburiae TaxID=61645 RepID=A0A376F6S9_ENTAS|nr:Putrescine/proton symporter, putrescine/ornithine antiporter PotE [Enterobacter asburiae]
MLYGAMVTFMGWTLYGLVSPRFELKNKPQLSKSKTATHGLPFLVFSPSPVGEGG